MQSRVRNFVNIGIAVVISATASVFFTTLFNCNPIERSWNAAIPGKCFNPDIPTWLSTVTSVVTDIYILVLPIAPLWRLNMKLRDKIKVMVAFSFGIMYASTQLRGSIARLSTNELIPVHALQV
jgi:hypothetical protein